MKLFVVALCLLSFGWLLLFWNDLHCQGELCRPQGAAEHVSAVLFAFGRVALGWSIVRALISIESPGDPQ